MNRSTHLGDYCFPLLFFQLIMPFGVSLHVNAGASMVSAMPTLKKRDSNLDRMEQDYFQLMALAKQAATTQDPAKAFKVIGDINNSVARYVESGGHVSWGGGGIKDRCDVLHRAGKAHPKDLTRMLGYLSESASLLRLLMYRSGFFSGDSATPAECGTYSATYSPSRNLEGLNSNFLGLDFHFKSSDKQEAALFFKLVNEGLGADSKDPDNLQKMTEIYEHARDLYNSARAAHRLPLLQPEPAPDDAGFDDERTPRERFESRDRSAPARVPPAVRRMRFNADSDDEGVGDMLNASDA